MRKACLLALSICLILAGKAQDSLKVVQLSDVVITGNKTETPIEKSGKMIYKLDRQQIEANRGKDVTDLLNEIPGVQIDGNFGTPGSNINYRIRGAANYQTLILIDGVPFNDPSSASQQFDLRYLDLDQIESIEVLKGGLSSLYGTGASAGVINITLKKAAKDPISGGVNVDYGSFNTFSSNANISGSVDGFNYMVSGTFRQSDGISAAEDLDNTGTFDNDGLKSINFLGKFGYDFSEQFSLGFLAASDYIDSDYDDGAYLDADSFTELELLKFGLSPTYKWTGGSIKGNITYHMNNRVFNSPDFSDPTVRYISEFDGTSFQSDVVLDQNLTYQVKFVGGVNFQQFSYSEPMIDQLHFNLLDPYASFIYDLENFNLQVGGRLNNHSEYGSHFVWNVNPSYIIDLNTSKLKILGAYSTSFVAPSLYQLFNDFYGNAALTPEESQSTEAGFEVLSNGLFQFSGVYFYRKDENAINFVSMYDDEGNWIGGTYSNLEGFAEVDGVELNANYSFSPRLSLSGHYTYTRSMRKGAPLFRIPENKFGFSVSAIPMEGVLIKVTHLHAGRTIHSAFPTNIIADPYNLIDVYMSYDLYRNIAISGSVNNLFDEDYLTRLGYLTVGRNYTIGFRYNF